MQKNVKAGTENAPIGHLIEAERQFVARVHAGLTDMKEGRTIAPAELKTSLRKAHDQVVSSGA